MNIFKLTLSLVILFGAFSCSSDNDNNDPVTPPVVDDKMIPYIMQAEFNPDNMFSLHSHTINYDELNRINTVESQLVFTNSVPLDSRVTVNYDGNTNKVISRELSSRLGLDPRVTETFTFTYNGNTISSSNGDVFTLNDKGLLVEYNNESVNIKYEYDSNSNLSIATKTNKEDNTSSEQKFSYDLEKIGCFKYVNAPQWFLLHYFSSDDMSMLCVGQNINNPTTKVELKNSNGTANWIFDNKYSTSEKETKYLDEIKVENKFGIRFWWNNLDDKR